MAEYKIMEKIEKNTADFLVELISFMYGGRVKAKATSRLIKQKQISIVTVEVEEWEAKEVVGIIAFAKGALLVLRLMGGIEKVRDDYRNSEHLDVLKAIQKNL